MGGERRDQEGDIRTKKSAGTGKEGGVNHSLKTEDGRGSSSTSGPVRAQREEEHEKTTDAAQVQAYPAGSGLARCSKA